MAVSAFQKVVNKLFQQFIRQWGREPQTPKEWMDLQNEAVQYFNRTKGVPSTPKAPPFQGWKPKVIPGGKGIESLLETGDVMIGTAPKTKLSTLEGKKQKLDRAISKEEWIAKKKAENKAAIERFKEKTQKKTVEDFRDEGDWDPGGFAGGGPVNLQQLIQMYMEEGMSHEEAVQAAEAAQSLPWDTLTKAQGGRIDLGAGGLAKGAKWFIASLKKNLEDMEAGHPRFKVVPVKEQKMLMQGYKHFIASLERGNEVPVEALEAISKNPQYYKTKKVVRSQDPDLAEVEALIDEKVFGDVRQELKDFEVVGRKPQASGGLAYMLGEPTYMKSAGGKVGHGPWTIGHTPEGPQSRPEMPQPQVAGTPDPLKAPRLPNVAPRNMDPQVMQQQRMQQAMMQQQQPRMGMKDGGIKLGPLEIKPRASGSFTEGPYGPDEQRTWEDQIGLDAELDLPWGFELKGEYDKRRIKDRLYSPDDEYLDERVRADDDRWGLELVWKKKFNQGGRVPMMYGGDPGFAFEYGGSWADWHDQHRNVMPIEDYIKTKLPKERLPFRQNFAGGGMTRRAFMKLMAGLASLPFIGKGVQKAAPKVIPKVTETVIERGADGIPKYAFDLIEVVKAKGTKEIMEGIYKRSPPSTKYNYKGVEVIEDGTGGTSVRKEQTKTGHWTDEATDDTIADEYVDREVGFEIKQGEIVEGKKGQPIKTGDEYNESTAYMQGEPDGSIDVSEVVEVIDDADHLELKEIADEVIDLPIRKKKASGGLAHLLGE